MTGDTDLDRRPSAPDSRLRDSVPVIDIGDLSGGVDASLESVGQIASACRDWGFFQVVNHGIPAELVDAVWAQTRGFFALSADKKEAILRDRDNPWGYYNNELTKNQRDKKEVFDFTSGGVDPVYRAENRWPDFDSGFRTVLQTYRDRCVELALTLLRAMSAGLGVPARPIGPRANAARRGRSHTSR